MVFGSRRCRPAATRHSSPSHIDDRHLDGNVTHAVRFVCRFQKCTRTCEQHKVCISGGHVHKLFAVGIAVSVQQKTNKRRQFNRPTTNGDCVLVFAVVVVGVIVWHSGRQWRELGKQLFVFTIVAADVEYAASAKVDATGLCGVMCASIM